MFASPFPNDHEASSQTADRMTLLRQLLDGVNRSAPLPTLLERASRLVQQLFDVDSVTIWLREEGGLRLSASSGEGPDRDRVPLGSGAVGLCAATRAPVFSSGDVERLVRPSVLPCDDTIAFRVVAPLLVQGEAQGVIAIESRGRPIPETDAEMLVALSAGIAGAIRADQAARSASKSEPCGRRTGGGTRRVVLRGKSFAPGEALGPVTALRRLPRRLIPGSDKSASRAVRGAFEAARQTVRELAEQGRMLRVGRDAAFLSMYEAMLEDGRFEDAAVERIARGATIHEAFDQLARDAIRCSQAILGEGAGVRQRASDAEDLFGAVAMLAQDDPRARPQRASVLVGASLTPYDLLLASKSHPVGVVLTEQAQEPRTRTLLRLLAVPALVDVGGVNRWVSDGDIALLDATRGFVLLNPTRTEVAALRASRRAG